MDDEFTRVYEEYTRRVATVQALSENIIQLWAELGTPQAQTDSLIVKHYRDSPEQLGLHEDDISRLRSKRDRLTEERRSRERRLKELKTTVESLWDRLGVDDDERKQFVNKNRGCGLRQINEFEDELSRLNELKRQNLHLFVEDARYKLQELWDGLYFSEEEMLEFTPAFSDVYSDALLEAHEQEIARLDSLQEQRAPTLALIDKHRSLVKDRDDLAAASQDASRLMMRGQKGEKRDPTRLLREEKMRKRISKDLPKVAADLKKALEKWEDEYGRPFLVHGARYLDELEASEMKPPPGPRSKTPAGLPPPQAVKKSNLAAPSRANSVRGPPSRAGAKTPVGADTVKRNVFSSSVSTAGGRTPSRIPARPPLSSLPHGTNSPERRAHPESRTGESTARKMAPPAHAPPPKMRDIVMAPPIAVPVQSIRSNSVESSRNIRQVALEDVYDDRHYPEKDRNSNYDMHPYSNYHEGRGIGQLYQYPSTHSSRQISNTSTAPTTVSSSENWETYDDPSEPEDDVTEAYYAKLQGSRNKREIPYDVYPIPQGGQQKRQRGIPPGTHANQVLVDLEGNRIISGSETNWTDEDAY